MVLVDTSVWIDFFKNKESAEVNLLQRAIADREDIAICGLILTEVLQGIKTNKEYDLVLESFESLSFLEMDKEVYILAANIYRELRKNGITIRKSIDCLIAAVAISHNIPLLHNDKDFEPIVFSHNLLVFR